MSAAPLPEDAANLPDWLRDIIAPAAEAAAAETAEPPATSQPPKKKKMTDWLGSAPPPTDHAATDPNAELPDWLRNLSAAQTGAPEDMPAVEPAPADDLPEWLRTVSGEAAARQGNERRLRRGDRPSTPELHALLRQHVLVETRQPPQHQRVVEPGQPIVDRAQTDENELRRPMAVEAHSAQLVNAVAPLGAAVVAVPIFRRIVAGSVVGYLAAGMVIGPFGLRLFTDPASILSVAEFGVVLLLFVIRLEADAALSPVKRPAMPLSEETAVVADEGAATPG